jgi:hypothetical protein
MTLNAIPSHPSNLCYVLKLHRDSRPAQGQIAGLLEHVATGEARAFEDADGLVAALLAHAAADAARACRHAGGEPL